MFDLMRSILFWILVVTGFLATIPVSCAWAQTQGGMYYHPIGSFPTSMPAPINTPNPQGTDPFTPQVSDPTSGTPPLSSPTNTGMGPSADPSADPSTDPTFSDPTGGDTNSIGTAPYVISGPPVSDMVLTFDDEFNVLNASNSGKGTLWETKFWYNSPTHSNWGNLDLDPAVCNLGLTPFTIQDGILNIHEKKTDPRLTACGVSNPYTSGNLYSYYSFWQQYGYFEVRAQASGIPGTTFAFWMLPKDGSWPPEIDVTETLGRQPMIHQATNHTGRNNTTIAFPIYAGTDLSKGFHTYGVLWNQQSITFFLDGRIVAKTPTGADENKPFFMILGLGVGTCGGWVGCPLNPDSFSADVYIDHVRAWQYADQNPQQCVGNCVSP